MIDLEKAKKEFEKYAKKYNFKDPMINLKYNHSLRVTDLCEEIANYLSLDKEQTALIALIGLLHDIGRFEQYSRYKTFSDIESIDHAGYALNVLFDENLIRKFVKEDKYDEIIKKAIYAHNKLSVLPTYTDEEQLYSKIIRDADKIDILYILANDVKEIKFNEEIVTDKVIGCFLNKELVDKKYIRTELDNLIANIAYVYDINFDFSLNILKQRNYVNTTIDSLSLKEENSIIIFNKLKNQINEDLIKGVI
jgi:HD superfamily phosphohydrolase YqeK